MRARRYHPAIRLAEPSQFFTVTGLFEDWQQNRKAMGRVMQNLRRTDGLTLALAWAVEPNPDGTGYHAHGWLWGSHLPQDLLARRARQAGWGEVTDIRPVTYDGNYTYMLKNTTHNQASLAEHLRLNGSQLIHAQHFWRDATTGEKLTRDQAVARTRPDTPHKNRAWDGDWYPVLRSTIGEQP